MKTTLKRYSELNIATIPTEAVAVTEKWKVLESLLTGMDCLRHYHYKYLGMNYSRHPETKRVRFEYVFRNSRTVWLGFTYYPANQRQMDFLDLEIHSPYMREALCFPEWIKRYSHGLELQHFNQVADTFDDCARELVTRIDTALAKSGLEQVLSGESGMSVPTFNIKI